MADDPLTEFLRDRAGANLRGVIEYDGDGFEVHYRREGLDADAFRRRVEYAYNRIIHSHTTETELASYGKPYATLSFREYAIILNLRSTPTEGVIVGLEPDAARDLVSFIHETMEHGLPEGLPPQRETE